MKLWPSWEKALYRDPLAPCGTGCDERIRLAGLELLVIARKIKSNCVAVVLGRGKYLVSFRFSWPQGLNCKSINWLLK